MRSLEKQQDSRVQVPTGDKSNIENVGNAVILGSHKITNVLHVPDFKFNLLLVSKLTKKLLCSVCCFPNFCVFQGLYNGKVMGIGRENNGLYILQREEKSTIGEAILKDADSGELWHLRLGHPSIGAMYNIPSIRNKVNDNIQEHCSVCPMAKQSRLKFPSSESKSNSIFQLVHVDLWGPYKRPTFDSK